MEIRYPIMPKERSREVRTQIRQVFNDVWDPIGVMKDSDWPRDEYDGYIGHMFELLTSSVSDQQIVEYLNWCAARMGMDASRHSHQDVIDALRKIPLNGLRF
jgi:hypothetical protein